VAEEKPKRTPKKKAEETPVEPEAVGQAPDEAEEKPKRTRKKKAEEAPAEPEVVTEAAPEEVEEPVAEAAPPPEVEEAPATEVEPEVVAEVAPEEAEEPSAEEPPAEEPPAEQAPAAEVEAPAEAAAPERAAKPKRKPRRERRLRPSPKREKPEGRKPITHAARPGVTRRGPRQERRGVVVSSAMEKTIVVRVETVKAHPRYKKVVRRSHRFHAHDEQNAAKVGDVVRIVETRPLSKTKNWRLAEVLEEAK